MNSISFFDSTGAWRCGGRLSNADVQYSAKHSSLLPKGHGLTTLIVRRAHQRVLHNGMKETLTELCSRYWVVKSRLSASIILHQHTICHRFERKEYLLHHHYQKILNDHHHCYSLEINCCVKEPEDKEVQNNPKDVSTTEFEKSTSAVDKDNADTDTAKRWPRRAAALKARARGKAWTTYEITHD